MYTPLHFNHIIQIFQYKARPIILDNGHVQNIWFFQPMMCRRKYLKFILQKVKYMIVSEFIKKSYYKTHQNVQTFCFCQLPEGV